MYRIYILFSRSKIVRPRFKNTRLFTFVVIILCVLYTEDNNVSSVGLYYYAKVFFIVVFIHLLKISSFTRQLKLFNELVSCYFKNVFIFFHFHFVLVFLVTHPAITLWYALVQHFDFTILNNKEGCWAILAKTSDSVIIVFHSGQGPSCQLDEIINHSLSVNWVIRHLIIWCLINSWESSFSTTGLTTF